MHVIMKHIIINMYWVTVINAKEERKTKTKFLYQLNAQKSFYSLEIIYNIIEEICAFLVVD